MARLVSRAFLILTAYVGLALCQNENTTTTAANNTASGGERVGWVSPGSRRSTWDIIWSCLTVFFICSWKCTHLNIPNVSESEAGWYKTRAIPWWPFSKPRKTFCLPLFPEAPLLRKWARKLGFMALIAIAPEVVVALAASQCMQAWIDLKDVSSPKFTMSHAFFARMGGFVLRYREQDPGQKMQGQRPDKRITVLHLKGVAILEDYGISFNVDSEDIEDRSKADGFTKLFALVQAGSLVVQSIARKAKGLQITELELMTIAFTACALATYILWWHKPFDAERAIVLDFPDLHAEHREILAKLRTAMGQTFVYEPGLNKLAVKNLDSDFLIDILFDFSDLFDGNMAENSNLPNFCSSIALYASSAAFSAIHLAAYNWTFPYPVVQTLWRTFSLAALGSSMLPMVINTIVRILPDSWYEKIVKWADRVLGAITIGALLVNVLSRLALIGLTFYCFTSMPVSVYSDLDWTKFLPHFS
ncbi:hypothetical protein DM02DRAFT_613069 [Periconia macrospinosa]|uniref:Uncharacterized protein n=1 Tax=Periconia macrospinosa TaxID=97972 RepID=A0A2V1DYD4_9PLEO|nr:hypothetical protein DM02DRAFT_613069 [Periconia macrospinosa]